MKDPTPDDVYQFVKKNSKPFVTSKDVADRFDSVSRRTVNARLNLLADDGKIEKREVGGNAVLWWVQRSSDGSSGPAASASASRRLPSSESQ